MVVQYLLYSPSQKITLDPQTQILPGLFPVASDEALAYGKHKRKNSLWCRDLS